MKIFCCKCQCDVEARLTTGAEVYPHRSDLLSLPFWKCDGCGNWVGCHHKTPQKTRPLGCIPTPELKRARSHIHALIDPVWKEKKMRRGKLYARLSRAIGYEFHSAEIRTIDEARRIYRVAMAMLEPRTEGGER